MDGTERWTLAMLEALLSVDYVVLKELVAHVMELRSAEASTAYFKDLLGESAAVNDFISEFNSRRFGIRGEMDISLEEKGIEMGEMEGLFKGQMSGKIRPYREKTNVGRIKQAKTSDKCLHSVFNESLAPIRANGIETALEEKSVTTPKVSAFCGSSLEASDGSSQFRERKPKLGILTSELGMKKPKKMDLKLASLSDIDSALKRLELSEIKSQGRKKCYCQARKHPLNHLVPNCLICGKIICVVEGINSCSFCNTPLLSREQQMDLVRQLRMERSHILGQKSKKPAIGKDTKQLYSTCYVGYNSINKDEFEKKAQDAENDKNRLLELDRANMIDKIIDEASDFDPLAGPDRWATPAERFLMLEKQRKALASMNAPKKKVMTIDLSGKVTIDTPSTDDEDNMNDDIKEKSNFPSSKFEHSYLSHNGSSMPVFLITERTNVKNISNELDYTLKSQIPRVQDDRD
ncbi:uncharacterized protein T551_00738 [Pneumocystis jirovecii RU7]|uniref:TRIP4/RQT4 C2HC5-type zinc finger domain-containing protein n=1 Tax=Pneumocystis jirovecii (strain RU7) TaxID=1408657 RepID=A0A0W4ZUL5_PNEJ7|nr:uncharacterized protein T551_00738 [Pneumocystis jirovecii RU7]KTW32056.1 hypothetical protein T551_00738 [Pneumocystis jirovecii RU7]